MITRFLSTDFNRSYIRQVYIIVLNYSSYSRSYLYSWMVIFKQVMSANALCICTVKTSQCPRKITREYQSWLQSRTLCGSVPWLWPRKARDASISLNIRKRNLSSQTHSPKSQPLKATEPTLGLWENTRKSRSPIEIATWRPDGLSTYFWPWSQRYTLKTLWIPWRCGMSLKRKWTAKIMLVYKGLLERLFTRLHTMGKRPSICTFESWKNVKEP